MSIQLDMKIANLLNTNIITKVHDGDSGNIGNNIDIDKLSRILNTRIDNSFHQLTYIGQGHNGDIYQIYSKHNPVPYICKCIQYNPDTISQVKKELGLLRAVQNFPDTAQFINPCVGVILTQNMIVSIFPTFNGVALSNVKQTLFSSQISAKHRNILIKYIIKQILDAVSKIHNLDVCHLQLNDESIVIDTKNNKFNITTEFNSRNTPDTYEYNNDNVDPKKLNTVHPTNRKIYKPEYSESVKPLVLKLTNFGMGCGKIIAGFPDTTNIEFLRCNLIGCTDPHITAQLNSLNTTASNAEYLKLAKAYDIYLAGLIIKSLIYKAENTLHDDTFKPYEDALIKHIFVPLTQRQNAKFIQEKIILDEKHDYDSGF